MRSEFFKFSAKLALMLMAICGTFASCYEKDDVDVEVPSGISATYNIVGVVSDATKGGVLDGVTVTVKNANGTKSAQTENGTYQLAASVGVQTVTFVKDGYNSISQTVVVAAVESGVANYPVDVHMVEKTPGIEDVYYKTFIYHLEFELYDQDGNKIALTPNATTTKVPGIDALTFMTGGFKTGVAQLNGTYVAIINVDGYNKTTQTVTVREAPKEVAATEGETKEIYQKVRVTMEKKVTVVEKKPVYYIQGNVADKATGSPIKGAGVVISFSSSATKYSINTDNNGYYFVKLLATDVVATTMAIINVTPGLDYMPATKSSLVKMVNSGETGVTTLDFDMTSLVEKGASAEAEVLQGASTGTKKMENVPVEKKLEITVTDPAGGTETAEVELSDEAQEALQKVVADATASGVNAEIAAVVMPAPVMISLTSTVAEVSATSESGVSVSVETQKDEVVIPQTTIIYTNSASGSTAAPQAQAISLERTLEKETTSEDASKEQTSSVGARSFKGEPSGVIFAEPIQIKFEAPAEFKSAPVKPDYSLSVLYKDAAGVWKSLDNQLARYDDASKKFVGKISHFSEFKFGFDTKVSGNTISKNDKYKTYSYDASTDTKTNIIVNGTYDGGLKYENGLTAEDAVAKAFNKTDKNDPTVKYISGLLINMIRSAYSMVPTKAYTTKSFSQSLVISANTTVTGFVLALSEEKRTFTINAIDGNGLLKPISVTVLKTNNYEVNCTVKPGHGHGNDFNAGGGIVDLD